jgi:hypothetical protein
MTVNELLDEGMTSRAMVGAGILGLVGAINYMTPNIKIGDDVYAKTSQHAMSYSKDAKTTEVEIHGKKTKVVFGTIPALGKNGGIQMVRVYAVKDDK